MHLDVTLVGNGQTGRVPDRGILKTCHAKLWYGGGKNQKGREGQEADLHVKLTALPLETLGPKPPWLTSEWLKEHS